MPNSAATPTIKLNLLYNQGVPQKITVRILKWLLSYGKFIVIIVDILVIVAFAYRLKLDYDLSNLNRRINTQLDFIESLSQEELMLTQFQERLALTQTTYKQYPDFGNFFTKITSQIPKSITLSNLSFEKSLATNITNFKFTGQTNNNTDLSIFLASLKKDFNNVNLDGISYSEGSFTFLITGEIR